jgi:hypothetical protein
MTSEDVFSGGALGSMRTTGLPSLVIDMSIAHPARMYDYFLGGKDNFPADREAAEKIVAAGVHPREFARANRRFLARQGITQFLDIGTGIPAAGNTHEVAQQTSPEARVVYVDNDPIVLTHARALIAGHRLGTTTVIQADLRDPAAILAHPEVRAAIDFDRPIGLILVAVLHFIREDEDPDSATKLLRDALPAGSYLVISHGTDAGAHSTVPTHGAQVAANVYRQRSSSTLTLRSKDRIAEFFGDFELVAPGLVSVPSWQPDEESDEDPADDVIHTTTALYAGVARKH